MKNLQTYKLLIAVLFLLSCLSCSHKGYIVSEKTNPLERKSEPVRNVEKLVIIDPFFVATRMTEVSLIAHNFYRNMEEKISDEILSSAESLDLGLKLYDNRSPEIGPDYYNELVRLKQEIQRANILQLGSLDRDASYPRRSQSLTSPGFFSFKYNPKISPEYSCLSNNYNTRYFSVMGFVYRGEPRYSTFYKVVSAPFRLTLGHLFGQAEGVFFHIVVDVHESEIIYREHREVTTLDDTHMRAIIYDSLSIVKNL